MHHLQYILLVDGQRMLNTFLLFFATILCPPAELYHFPLEELPRTGFEKSEHYGPVLRTRYFDMFVFLQWAEQCSWAKAKGHLDLLGIWIPSAFFESL